MIVADVQHTTISEQLNENINMLGTVCNRLKIYKNVNKFKLNKQFFFNLTFPQFLKIFYKFNNQTFS